ncbi:hypothetical protein QMY03_00770 [Arthrobacter sp. KFRI-F3372]|uniref:hypothetical protein n=1 Tax=Pseudarthrobacter oxydans TaxID=1671 RepID=UPI00203B176A|nr:hypothetical protein [Arthrobacter sp.]WHP59533.1 hypothetical protein QMY03_00770 [Arthrobacter sp. KFRI-F3372]GKV71890.1 hypothetical protein NCCP2145_12710 [Pseudarthrobacter sp. NCCP-2145]
MLTAIVTVLAFDTGMGGWMLFMQFGNFMPAPTDISFFFLMQVGLVLEFFTAYQPSAGSFGVASKSSRCDR